MRSLRSCPGDVGGAEQGIPNPKGTTAGITFFGQFIDHDLTLETSPQPDAPVDVNTLVNGRTFAFDLGSVYGGGPSEEPAAVLRRQVQDRCRNRWCDTGPAAHSSSKAGHKGDPALIWGEPRQPREPDHCSDSPVVPAAAQRTRRPGHVVR